MTKAERFEGCILCGAIGDAMGSGYENLNKEEDDDIFYPNGKPDFFNPKWQITDDTQLTLATIEAMMVGEKVTPESIANQMLKYYKIRKIKGIGASTLKSLEELNYGRHWSLTGRIGEYAAGNGAAMRISPFGFTKEISNSEIRDICSITHNNDDAYIGALCVVISIREILNENWDGSQNLMKLIIEQIPDTRIRDRLIEIKDMNNIEKIGRLGNDGYVVNSIPLAIAAANKVNIIGIEKMYEELINVGGDTDTNCSIAGQIAGALIGRTAIPNSLMTQLKKLYEYDWINSAITNLSEIKGWKISN